MHDRAACVKLRLIVSSSKLSCPLNLQPWPVVDACCDRAVACLPLSRAHGQQSLLIAASSQSCECHVGRLFRLRGLPGSDVA